jgi:hypothetical protein
VIAFEVIGAPAPKGSSRAMLRGGSAVNVPSGSDANKIAQADWATSVARMARGAARGHLERLRATVGEPGAVLYREGALAVGALYRFPMRAGDLDKKTGRPKLTAPYYLPTGKDVEKLNRATHDAITLAGNVWRDDAQVSITASVRVYAPPGAWCGALLVISEASSGWELVARMEDETVRLALEMGAAKEAGVLARSRARMR